VKPPTSRKRGTTDCRRLTTTAGSVMMVSRPKSFNTKELTRTDPGRKRACCMQTAGSERIRRISNLDL